MDPLEQIHERVGSLSLEFVEGLLADYLRDPESVSPDWRSYFDEITRSSGGNGHNRGQGNGHGPAVTQIGPSFKPNSLFAPPRAARAAAPRIPAHRPVSSAPATTGDPWHIAVLQDRLDQLVRAYRVRGHLVAEIDPLGLPRPELPELDPEFYGFTESDMDREFSTDTIQGPQAMTLRRILQRCATLTAARSACNSCTWTI